MGIGTERDWRPLTHEHVRGLAAHMGVYQLGANGHVVAVGFAGGDSPFGLRGELERHLDEPPRGATHYRLEVTTAYLSRFRELVAAHVHEHGDLPALPEGFDAASFGRVSPV